MALMESSSAFMRLFHRSCFACVKVYLSDTLLGRKLLRSGLPFG